jgi:phage-related holin
MFQSATSALLSSKSSPVTDSLTKLLISVIAVFAPLKTVMFALLFLISTDLVTGVWSAIITNTPLTSRRLARTVVKTFVYLTTICVVHVANKYLLSAGEFSLPLDTLIVSFIALTELKSILENLQKIQKQPLLQFLIDRIASDSSRAVEQLEKGGRKAAKSKEKKGGTSKRQKQSD